MIPIMPPALTAAVVALVNAILSVVINFGISLTEDQRVSIVTLTNAVLVIAALVWHYLKPAAGASGGGTPTAPPAP